MNQEYVEPKIDLVVLEEFQRGTRKRIVGNTPTRYEAYVDRCSGSCHLWTGNLSDGYGTFYLNGKTVKAHRYGWELRFGPIPEGLCVLHSCDNPPCQNPDHWFLGTVADNNQDKMIKGRHRAAAGEQHGSHVLTEVQVQEIRHQLTGRYGEQKELAALYGVSNSTIWCIAHGKRWS